jgi:hypothetical protein
LASDAGEDDRGSLLRAAHTVARALHRLPVLGTPEAAMVPSSMLFDTAHHLNCEGRRVRTKAVISSLSSVLGAVPAASGLHAR